MELPNERYEQTRRNGAAVKVDAEIMNVRRRLAEIHAQREEILSAFIAKYGVEPDRVVQVEQRMEDGTTRWFVHRRSDDDMAEMALRSAML